jgi:hypothetical protein
MAKRPANERICLTQQELGDEDSVLTGLVTQDVMAADAYPVFA